MSPSRAFPLAFYLGGALIAVGGFLGAMAGPSADWMPEGGFASIRASDGAQQIGRVSAPSGYC